MGDSRILPRISVLEKQSHLLLIALASATHDRQRRFVLRGPAGRRCFSPQTFSNRLPASKLESTRLASAQRPHSSDWKKSPGGP
jgi:hypothetical protein